MADRTSIAAGLALLATAGCAGGPMKASVPYGLAFDCDPGGMTLIRFNDGGYLPDSTGRDGAMNQVPRSTAQLTWQGQTRAMVAEWAEFGLRYRAAEPGAGGASWVWSQRGEMATLAQRPAGAADDTADAPVATCRRSGRGATPGG